METEHPIYRMDREQLDMDEYQSLAASTAIYPRVFTEQQVLQMMGHVSGTLEELHNVHGGRLVDAIGAAMDEVETPFNRLVYPVLGLVGEAGEIANKLKKVARDKGGEMEMDRSEEIEAELGDVQWYVAACATGLKTKLVKIGNDNIDKLFSRKQRGVLAGDGDKR